MALDKPPTGSVWTRVAIVGGIGVLAACGHGTRVSNSPPPTCGPCCHGSTGPECQPQPPPPDAGPTDAG